jgi:hypothetical protein
VFRSTTQFAAAWFRTQLFNPDDIPNVIKVQSGYQAQPLSPHLKQPAPPAAPAINFLKVDDELMSKNSFEYLDFMLPFAPAVRIIGDLLVSSEKNICSSVATESQSRRGSCEKGSHRRSA